MNIEDIKLKLVGLNEELNKCIEKRNKYDAKIQAIQKKIDDYNNLIQCQQYSKLDNALESLGLSREELINALQSNNLQSIQDAIASKTLSSSNDSEF